MHKKFIRYPFSFAQIVLYLSHLLHIFFLEYPEDYPDAAVAGAAVVNGTPGFYFPGLQSGKRLTR